MFLLTCGILKSQTPKNRKNSGCQGLRDGNWGKWGDDGQGNRLPVLRTGFGNLM